MIERMWRSDELNTPTGTPTERLIVIGLRYLLGTPDARRHGYAGVTPVALWSAIGGSYRALSDSLANLIKNNVVEEFGNTPDTALRLVGEARDKWRDTAWVKESRAEAAAAYAESEKRMVAAWGENWKEYL
jgi:hypothetical protein